MMRKRKHTISLRPACGKLAPRRGRYLSLFSEFLKRARGRSLPREFSRHNDEAPEELRDKKYEIAALREIVRDVRVILLENIYTPEIV